MATDDQLACTYSALILADDEIPITGSKFLKIQLERLLVIEGLSVHKRCDMAWLIPAEKLSTILKAANVQVEPIWPSLFARALSNINVRDLITKVGSTAGAASGAPAAAATAAPAEVKEEKKEAKKEEKKEEEEEEDEDMGFGLFD